jgi:tetratricopeptide (TPR) repeat protein
MKRFINALVWPAIAAFIFLLCCATTGGEDGLLSLEEAIEQSAVELAAELPRGARVAIAGFVSEHESLSNYIMDELTGALVDGSLEVADRRNLEYVYRELHFQMSGDVSDETSVSIGKFLGASYVITGQLVKTGSGRRYRLSGINVETAVQESSTRLNVRDDQVLKKLIAAVKNDPVAVSTAGYGGGGTTQPKTPGAFLDQGLFSASQGDYDNAIVNFTEALDIDPDYAAAYNNRGILYANSGMYDQAIEDYNAALRIAPDLAYAYTNRGNAYDNKGMYDQAIEDYNAALRITPNLAAAYYNRGIAYGRKGMYDRAIEDFGAALKIDPNYAAAYTSRGIMYGRKGLYDQAIKDYRAALKIDPNYAAAYYNRGIAYTGKERYNRAIEDYSAVLRLDPNYTAAYYNRGVAYYFKRMYDQAIEDFNAVLRLDPNFILARNHLELARRARGY